MEKNTPDFPEIVLGSSDTKQSKALSRALHAGHLRKIAPRIYTSNLRDEPDDIIKRHRYFILSQLYPNAVISHRSALTGGISADGSVVLSYKYTKNISLPGLHIRLVEGPGPDIDDTPFLDGLYIASQSRAYLENLQESRARQKIAKTVSIGEVEERLDRCIRIFGQEGIQALRDQARRVADRLGMKSEFTRLDKLIGALLGTRSEQVLQTTAGKLRAQGLPFDPERIELFAVLTAHLLAAQIKPVASRAILKNAKRNQAFFEAYFSNYIEGTRFEIEEAEKIIFENKIFPNRPADSHDVLETFRIISDDEMMTVPRKADELLHLLQKRHATLMQARVEACPGQFKQVINRAGNTVFVQPEEVRGTLIKGFEFYEKLPSGIARAIFIMFLIAEVHPFVDGNGRIARILMNTELEVCQEVRIIIPTVYREDYVLALRRLSRKQDPVAYTRMLLHAQSFAHSISFDDYANALIQLRASNAFCEPSEGVLRFMQ